MTAVRLENIHAEKHRKKELTAAQETAIAIQVLMRDLRVVVCPGTKPLARDRA